MISILALSHGSHKRLTGTGPAYPGPDTAENNPVRPYGDSGKRVQTQAQPTKDHFWREFGKAVPKRSCSKRGPTEAVKPEADLRAHRTSQGAVPPLMGPSEIEFGLAQASASKRETGRPRDGFSAKMARSAAEKRSRSERIPTEAEGPEPGWRVRRTSRGGEAPFEGNVTFEGHL